MKKLATLLITLLIWTASYGQELETLGAGVIDFLLTNPKTANQTNLTETAALRTIGKLLSISAHRKHEMNVAKVGRSEIIINTTDGNQAKMYADNQGNLYLLYEGKIYPIATDIINQARNHYVMEEIKNATLPGYNLAALKNEYTFEKTTEYIEYFLEEEKETLKQIAIKHNLSVDDIYIVLLNKIMQGVIWRGGWNYGKRYSKKTAQVTIGGCKLSSLYDDRQLIRIGNPQDFNSIYKVGNRDNIAIGYCYPKHWNLNRNFPIAIFLRITKFNLEIVSTFTYNWAKDFEGDGLDLDDFQGIKRSFYKDEIQLFVMGYTTETAGIWTLEIYEASSGETVYKNTGTANKGGQVVTVEKEGDKLPVGMYIYNFTLIADGQDKISKSEKFEILEDTEKKYAPSTTD